MERQTLVAGALKLLDSYALKLFGFFAEMITAVKSFTMQAE
jgi:hypothetical protein